MPDDAASYDITAHVYVLRAKAVKHADNFTAVPLNTLLNNGDNTYVPFDGLIQTSWNPINRLQFTQLKHKQIRLVKSGGQVFSASSAQTAPNPSHFHQTSFSVKMPKQYIYQENASGYPINDFPFLVIGWTRNTPSSETALTSSYLNVMGSSDFYYKDA